MNALLTLVCVCLFFSAVSAEFYRWENREFRRKISGSPGLDRGESFPGRQENIPTLVLKQSLQTSRNGLRQFERKYSRLEEVPFQSFKLKDDLGKQESRRKGEFKGLEDIGIVALKRGLEEFRKVKPFDSVKGKEAVEGFEPLLNLLLKGSLGKEKVKTESRKEELTSKGQLGGENGTGLTQLEESWKSGNFKFLEPLFLKGQGSQKSGASSTGFGDSESLGALSMEGGSGSRENVGWKNGFGNIGNLSGLKPKGNEKGRKESSADGMKKIDPLKLALKGFPGLGKFGGKKENPSSLGQFSSFAQKGSLDGKEIGNLGGIMQSEMKGFGDGSNQKSFAGFGGESILKVLGQQLANRGILNHAVIIKSYPILSHDWW